MKKLTSILTHSNEGQSICEKLHPLSAGASPAATKPTQLELALHHTMGGIGGIGMENLGSLLPLPLGATGPGDIGGERAGRPAAAGPALSHQQWHLLGLERAEAALVRAASAHWA